jgi:drug/metabolite transporter (DMT)-like permease
MVLFRGTRQAMVQSHAVSGLAYAAVAGVGFGIFQTVNRKAILGMDVYTSTFLQIVVSAVMLGLIVVAGGHLPLLLRAPAPALVNFGISGGIHYFAGWTLLNASQKRIGAARTSPLISTVPIFATLFAAAALREIPSPFALIGILTSFIGVYLIGSGHMSSGTATDRIRFRDMLFALGTALCWSLSPIFVRRGLVDVPSPLLGLFIGLIAAATGYGILMLTGGRFRMSRVGREALGYKVLAGVLVGLSQWARWVALALAPIGAVLSVAQLSVPVTVFFAPLFVGRHVEHVTGRTWAGAAAVVAGSIILFLAG